MKTHIKNLFPCLGVASVRSRTSRGAASVRSRILPALVAGLGLILADRVTAQTFTTLHSFTAPSGGFPHGNSDGAQPMASLIMSNNTLYGTTVGGGSSGNGTVFAIKPDGTGFTNLYSFTADYGGYASTNSDGVGPQAGLILSGNTLYGTATGGGISGWGTVFAVNTDGTGFTNLHSFTYPGDGAQPMASLIMSNNTLYGTARYGGSSGQGTLFALNTDGTGFTNLYGFTATPAPFYTNSDGAYPYAGLILSGNTLYGTAAGGGTSGNGTVFAVNTDGTGFTNLHSFTATSEPNGNGTNSDGATPHAGLILSGNTLCGTTVGGGSLGAGTVFAVNTDGTGFTNLYSFTDGSDGASPYSGLVLSGNTLYGTAVGGGSSGKGTVFALNTDGTGFTNLYSFAALVSNTNSDGATPWAGLILTNNTLFGTAQYGGSSGNGTVFSLTLPVPPPQLTLASDGNGGYFIRVQGAPNLTCRLQRAHSLTGSWSALVTNTAPASGLIEYHETSPPPGAAFYRTVQP